MTANHHKSKARAFLSLQKRGQLYISQSGVLLFSCPLCQSAPNLAWIISGRPETITISPNHLATEQHSNSFQHSIVFHKKSHNLVTPALMKLGITVWQWKLVKQFVVINALGKVHIRAAHLTLLCMPSATSWCIICKSITLYPHVTKKGRTAVVLALNFLLFTDVVEQFRIPLFFQSL